MDNDIITNFLDNYEIIEYLVQADLYTGQPYLISVEKDGENYLIKHWPRNGEQDDDLEEIWLHELRQLHRLKGYPGVGDYIVSVIDVGRDKNGFYLVLDAQERYPLSKILQSTTTLTLNSHWLKRLSRESVRICFWKNIIRIVKAVSLLHAQGWLHRDLNINSILTSRTFTEDIDFQLTGFEWSIRVPTMSSALVNQQQSEPLQETIYSFLTDWSDLGGLISALLKVNETQLRDLSVSTRKIAREANLMLSEITLIRALLGTLSIQSNVSREALTGELIEEAIETIITALLSPTQSNNSTFDLALNIQSSKKSSSPVTSLFNGVQEKFKERFDITLDVSNEQEIKEFIVNDLADDATLFLLPANKKEPKGFLLKGKELLYIIEQFPPESQSNDTTWDIGFCKKVFLTVPYWISNEQNVIKINSDRLKIFTKYQARTAFHNDVTRLSKTSWEVFFNELEQKPDSKTPEQKRLIQGLAVYHLAEMAYARTEIFPVQLLSYEIGEDNFWLVKIISSKDEYSERLSESLRLDPPAKRLADILLKNKGGEENINWALVSNSTFGKEEEQEISLSFQRSEITNDDQDVYEFTTKSPQPRFSQYFLIPSSVQGTIRQLSRRAKALDTLEKHTELMDVLIRPQGNVYKNQDTICEDKAYKSLDPSKQEAYRKIINTLPLYLVQGPPGVGKTFLITALMEHIFDQEPDSRILLTAQSHATVQHLYHEIEKSLLSSTINQNPKRKPLVIRCIKQEKDDESTLASVDKQAKDFLNQLIDSKMFRNSESHTVKSKILDMSQSSSISNRFTLINQLLRSANMVFATTNSAQVAQLILDQAQFDWSIMEETGKVTGLELLSPLLLSHRRLMIGDHQQLPPYRSVEMKNVLTNAEKLNNAIKEANQIANPKIKGEVVKEFLNEYIAGKTIDRDLLRDLGDSATKSLMLFERLVIDEERESNNYATKFGTTENRKAIGTMLKVQHRMHPDISQLISTVFYNNELKTYKTVEDNYRKTPSDQPFYFANTPELQASAALTWIDIPDIQSTKGMRVADEIPKWHNPLEVKAIQNLLKELRVSISAETPPKLAILSPYNEQVTRLTKMLDRDTSKLFPFLKYFIQPDDHTSYCSTIDAFQGGEADLVIVSLVRNNGLAHAISSLGILLDGRRVNVLLSRARFKLIIVGSFDFIKGWATKIQKKPSAPDYQQNEFLVRFVEELVKYEESGKLTRIPSKLLERTNTQNESRAQQKPNFKPTNDNYRGKK